VFVETLVQGVPEIVVCGPKWQNSNFSHCSIDACGQPRVLPHRTQEHGNRKAQSRCVRQQKNWHIRHLDGCAEAVLLAEGFSVGQLALLALEGLAETGPGQGGQRVWIRITEAGRQAIAE
jgi:hypothetical protein